MLSSNVPQYYQIIEMYKQLEACDISGDGTMLVYAKDISSTEVFVS